jgi:hypothetical protein
MLRAEVDALPVVRGSFHRMLRTVHSFRSSACVGIATAIAFCLLPEIAAQNRLSDSELNKQNATALVREVIYNEIEGQLHDTSSWCYREHREVDGKPNQTLEVCQTKDGDLERVLAVNGRELNLEQTRTEDLRIQQAIAHPEQLRAKQKKDREDQDQQLKMLRAFPEAFLFHCESESGNLVTLRFRPNPSFRPPNRVAMAFRHLEGTLVVDGQQKRLMEINGRLTSEVRFGGGLLGHLDKNGTFLVKQKDLGEGHWDLSYLSMRISGKALFFKTITVLEEKTLFDYQPLPRGASLQQAADFLFGDFDVHTATSSGK